MSDNQSWNSSGSEEDIEPREESGHLAGVVDMSGVLSKVGHVLPRLNFHPVYPVARSMSLPSAEGKTAREAPVCIPGWNEVTGNV